MGVKTGLACIHEIDQAIKQRSMKLLKIVALKLFTAFKQEIMHKLNSDF